jgi:polysaccharide export outer membrane protein
VLLARYGQLERARDALLQSVRARPLAETWHNLSVVHARLGEIELAQLARREAERAVQSSRRDEADMRSSRTGGPIRWVDPSEFAAAAPGWGPDAADVEWRPAAAETPPRRLPSGRLGGCPAAPPRPYKPAGPGVVALASDRCAAEPSLPADDSVRLCQACVPVIYGVDCESCGRCGEARWNAGQPLPWEVFAHGEYVGPHRLQHVPEYHLRVDDRLEFIYRLTREESPEAYQLNVGDEIRIESMADPAIERTLAILPDGMIALQLLGQVRAARRTVAQLQQDLEEKYKKYYKVPAITVTPVKVDTKLEDLRAAIDSRFGFGGQSRQTRVTPEGAVQLTGIGSVPAQGLTLAELKREIDERYAELVAGIEVTPVLLERAPRYVYVIGEVQNSGRYDLTGPTTVMQAIAMAGGWRNGGNLREVVVFRRAEDWRLIATKLDIRGALLGKRPCPADELWVRDSDIVLVPKSALMLADDFIDLVFTRGIYGVFPFQGATINFSKLSTL